MSQQYTQPPQSEQAQPMGYQQQSGTQPTYQAGTQTGQQLQQSPVAQAVGQQFQQSVPKEIQAAVMDLDQLESVCEWLKGRATQRGRPRIASRADDLAQVAHLEKSLLLRDSPFAEPIGQAVQQSIQGSVQELQQHAADPEVQEALGQAQQTLSSIGQAIAQFQQMGAQQQFGPQQQNPVLQQ